MLVRFFRGVIRKQGKEFQSFWAESNFGHRISIGARAFIEAGQAYEIVSGDNVASLELPGIAREDVEFLIQRILEGNYLEKPGAAGKGDAVLFMLVNEALNELAKLAAEELSE